MGKKRTVNKSAAVRNYLEQNPNAGPKEVSEALAKEKISITPAYVSNIKNKNSKKRAKRGRPRRAVAASTGSSNGALSVKLADAIQLVEKVGGLDKAKETLDAVKALEK